jgi:hypothetical protein
VLGLSEYRFIGIFRFKDGKANAALHYDRENPAVTAVTEVSDSATYCCHVRDSKGHDRRRLRDALPRLPSEPGIGSAHLLEGAATPPMTNEQRIRGADAGVDWAVLATGYSPDAGPDSPNTISNTPGSRPMARAMPRTRSTAWSTRSPIAMSWGNRSRHAAQRRTCDASHL